MLTHLFIVLSLCVVVLHAQTAEQINSTPVTTRQSWCQNQVSVCRNICSQTVNQNDCNYNTLQFNCICGNGTRMDFTETVDLTIPYFICINYNQQPCVAACTPGDQACTDKCNEQFPCGKVKADPTKTVVPVSTSTPGPTNPPSQAGNIDLNSAISSYISTVTVLTLVVGSIILILI